MGQTLQPMCRAAMPPGEPSESIAGGAEADLRHMLARAAEASAWQEMAEEISQLGHWRLTLPDRTLTWSTQVYRIHGVSPDSFVPTLKAAIGFYHADDRGVVRQALAAALKNAPSYDFTARVVRPDGEIRHVVSRGIARLGPDGKPAVLFGVVRDVTQERQLEQALRNANARLELLAHQDALTDLANRRRFDETLDREWRRMWREGKPLSLVMIDLDCFKQFNDRYGHPAGDACLQRIASILKQVERRSTDLAARYGGEELALILPGTDADGAEIVAEELRAAIEALGIPHEGNVAGRVVTASLGTATANPSDCAGVKTGAELIAETDRLLYEAKRTGRNRVVSIASLERQGPLRPPPGEAARLATLAAYEKAGAARRTADMDRIARLAASLTGAPIALVTLVSEDNQTFVGNFGLEHVEGTKRDISFCTHTICSDDPLIVPDATRDPRFRESPLVTGDLGIRYYAGAPLISPRNGQRLGALCVVDTAPHGPTGEARRAVLKDLASMAAHLLEEIAGRGE